MSVHDAGIKLQGDKGETVSLQEQTSPCFEWMDVLRFYLHPFQQCFSHIRMMGG